jgi:hypothetical protein
MRIDERTQALRIGVARHCRVPERAGAMTVHLTETGSMRGSIDGRWMTFSARQTLSVAEPRFVWTARFRLARLPILEVTDYLAADRGGMVGRLFGHLPLFRNDEGDEVYRGELARYLAEVIWNPDALLANPVISWQALDDRTLSASIDHHGVPVTVRLCLDDQLDIVLVECDSRPMVAGQTVRHLPWFARCGDHTEFGGRRIPRQGEAGWRIDGRDFVYWRGKLTAWGLDGGQR